GADRRRRDDDVRRQRHDAAAHRGCHAADRPELPASRAAGLPGARPPGEATDRAGAAADPAAGAGRHPAVAHARRPLGPDRHEVPAQGHAGGHHPGGREVPVRPGVHRHRRPAPVADPRVHPRRRHGADHLGARRPRPRPAGASAAGGDGQRHRTAARRRGLVARLRQRRHPLPALPRRGAGAVRPARRAHPPPGRHEGAGAHGHDGRPAGRRPGGAAEAAGDRAGALRRLRPLHEPPGRLLRGGGPPRTARRTAAGAARRDHLPARL
ncbi:MAG: hypothetical protein AVDCRST_MAG57-3203, partial [uncultured Blastococcus sp.]